MQKSSKTVQMQYKSILKLRNCLVVIILILLSYFDAFFLTISIKNVFIFTVK